MARTIQHAFPATLLVLLSAVAGCQIVHVQDRSGKAIAGAQVTSQYGSSQGPAGVTDRFGNAIIHRPLVGADPNWMTVARPGFLSRGITYPVDWIVVVELDRIAAEDVEIPPPDAQAN